MGILYNVEFPENRLVECKKWCKKILQNLEFCCRCRFGSKNVGISQNKTCRMYNRCNYWLQNLQLHLARNPLSPSHPLLKLASLAHQAKLKIQFSKRPRARQLDTTAWPKLPMSLLILWTPFWQKKCHKFLGDSISKGFDQMLFTRNQFHGGIFQH